MSAPEWIVARHGHTWHMDVLGAEGVIAWRHDRPVLLACTTTACVEPTWQKLDARLRREAEHDAACRARYDSSRRREPAPA